MKKKLLIAGGIFLVLVVGMFIFLTNGLSEGVNEQIHGIDLTNVADGDYVGEHKFKRWSETVTVSVRHGEITEIHAKKNRILDVSEEIINRVIAHQNTTVDTVSGATVSSKAFLKAIENALNP